MGMGKERLHASLSKKQHTIMNYCARPDRVSHGASQPLRRRQAFGIASPALDDVVLYWSTSHRVAASKSLRSCPFIATGRHPRNWAASRPPAVRTEVGPVFRLCRVLGAYVRGTAGLLDERTVVCAVVVTHEERRRCPFPRRTERSVRSRTAVPWYIQTSQDHVQDIRLLRGKCREVRDGILQV